jgi:hypothetical protein
LDAENAICLGKLSGKWRPIELLGKILLGRRVYRLGLAIDRFPTDLDPTLRDRLFPPLRLVLQAGNHSPQPLLLGQEGEEFGIGIEWRTRSSGSTGEGGTAGKRTGGPDRIRVALSMTDPPALG